MKRKVLSALICTAVSVSQASMIPTVVNAETTSGTESSQNTSGSTFLLSSDTTTKAAVSVINTTGAAVSGENIAEKVEWKKTEFGTSTSPENNTIKVDEANKTVTVTAGSKDGSTTGGKITGAQDGMSYYYTVIDPSQNFEFSADVKVNYFEKPKADTQAGFGIMARDTIGTDNDASISPSNMCLVGGYNGIVQSVFRNGVTKDYSEPIVMEGSYKFGDRPVNDGTATYKLKLRKTNTGYIASVNNGKEITYYRPKQLEVLDSSKIYLGFFAARVASITVSNIDLRTSNVATDPAGEKEPEKVVTPAISATSSATSGSSNYNLLLKSNVDGKVNVKLGESVLYDSDIKTNTPLKIPSILALGDNSFDIKYTPTQTTSAAVIGNTHKVIFKNYGVENGDVFVSPTGTENGKGTEEDPIDIYSAVKYTNNGQTIKVKGGIYNLTKPIVIDNTNSGTQGKIKTLTSYDGQRPIFDFGKKSGGFTIKANYWKVYGIDVSNTSDKQRGLTISGNNNLIENVKTYKNGDSGLQISGDSNDTIDNWPSNNIILNCESYDNMDAAMNNADGFAAKLTCGYGNLFKGCISHNNCDDGWDLYAKLESGRIGAVTIEDCIAYGNGTLTDGTVTKGDGNGFKLGGEGISIKHTLKNSLSFNNNTTGITSNSNPAMIVENCISTDNKKANINLHYYTGANLQYILKDNISYRTTSGLSDFIVNSAIDDSNYFYDGEKTSNKSGKLLTSDFFKSVEMPTTIERDSKGNIIWPNYMTTVNGTKSHGNDSADITDESTIGSTTGAAVTIKKLSPNIVVDANYAGNDGGQVDGIATYKTLAAAIKSIDVNNPAEKIIFIKNGVYKEKLTIATPNITIIGESVKNTVITYDDANGTIKRAEDGGNGTATYGTTGSASVTVKSTATNFSAVNLTISNSFDEAANASIKNQQAVAMKNEADHSVFINCRFLGNQDTLYPNANNQYYYKCYIEGDVDFIFGGAQAVFEKCEIHSLNRVGITPKGYVTAPSTLSTEQYGFLILNSNLTSDADMDGQVFLGRPWQPNYPNNNCKVLYKNCKLGDHIIADGWSTMSNTDKATNKSFLAYPKDNSMYEYNNYGPGENTVNTNRTQLNDEDAGKYTVANVLDGWDTSIVVKKLSSYLDGSGSGTGGSTTGGTTGGSTAGETTGGSTTGGTTTGETTGGTTTSSSSSHKHHNSSSSISNSSSTSSTSSSNSVSSTTSTTSTGTTTATGNGDLANKAINLGNASKEQAKEIEKQVISKVSAILGEGTKVSAAKEIQTSDGNKLTVTALVKDGKNEGLVIAAEKSSAVTTVQVDTAAGEVKAVYKFVPLLNKYIEVTDTVVIDKNTITLPTQANATYVAAADKLATNNVISEGWAKVDNSWYMVDKTGNPLTGWQKDSTGWVYLSPMNAAMQTGWKQDGANWYLLKDNGYMATGWVKTGDNWYYLNSDGSMASNTIVDGYTIGSDGALV